MTESGEDRQGAQRLVRIDRERLWATLMELKEIGAYDEEATGLRGVRRLALNDAGIETLRDVEVDFFTEGEGARFGTDMLGSAVTAGRVPLDHAHRLTDPDGRTVEEELAQIGFDGRAPELRPVPSAYLERHIEQGPILADAGVDAGADVGIVEGLQSISWPRLTVHGEASHAGTIPITSQHDAALVAASVVVELRRMCDSGDFGHLRATVGSFDIGEGQTNVIPHLAMITIDLRNPDTADALADQA